MVWKTETIIVEGKRVKGVQVREGDADSTTSLVRIDTNRMTSSEAAAVQEYFSPGSKTWPEGKYTVMRVQKTLLKYPEFRERFDKPSAPAEQPAPEGVPDQPQEFVYRGQISGKQLPHLRRWAAERGARVEESNPQSTADGTVWQYKIIAKADLLERQKIQRDIERSIFKPTPMQEQIGGFTPTDTLITRIPSKEAIEAKEREAFIQKTAAQKVKEQGAGARLRTLLSPDAGQEYIGAIVLGKDPTSIVQRKMESELRLQMTDPDPTSKYVRSVVETLLSPPMEVTLAFAAGVGFAKIGATRIGGKILASKAAKIALGAGAAYYVGTSGLQAYTDISMGRVERGVGRIVTTGLALGAGFVGAKAGAKEFARAPAKVDAEIQMAKTKGISRSVPETKLEPGRMAGVFETKIQVGKTELPVKGVILGASRATGKDKAAQVVKIFIPKQKVGKITIQETTLFRPGTVLKTGKGAYTVKTSEGVIIDITKGKFDVVLAGGKRGTGYYIEKAKIPVGDEAVRFYTGSGFETTGKVSPKDISRAVKLIGKGKTAARVGEIPRTDVKMAGVQDVKWIDISKPVSSGLPATKPIGKGLPGSLITRPSKGPAPSLKAVETPKPVAPTGKVSVAGPREALGLPTFALTATVASTISAAAVKSVKEIRIMPDVKGLITPSRTKQKSRSRAVLESARVTMPSSAELEIQIGAMKRDIDMISRNIPDVDIASLKAQKKASAVSQKQALKVSEVGAGVTVPAVAPPVIIHTPPTPKLGGLPGALSLGGAGVRVPFYVFKTIINPVALKLKIKDLNLGGI